MSYKLDIKDTINRIKGIGSLVNLHEDSNFAKIANALLSVERQRLDTSVEATKKNLGDWAGAELDNWWGTILSIERLPGVDDAETFIGDGTFVSRIKKYMEAGNMGISMEAVRMAAEAGSGVPFRINRANNRIILTPLETLSPPSKAGALKAVHRIAPARTIIEIGSAETYDSFNFTNVWSDSVYVGEDPSSIRTDGPHWDSPNMMVVASANRWAPAEEGTLGPGSGLPNLLMREGSWHVPDLGFGESAKLTLGTEIDQIINRVKISIGTGSWKITCYVDDREVSTGEIDVTNWVPFETIFGMNKGSSVTLEITNRGQEERSLFVKGAYVGVRIDSNNKESWLALGGEKGSGMGDVIIADTNSMLKGKEWVCSPAPDPSLERVLYAQVSGSPQKVSALSFKTRTPGALFKIAYSTEDIDSEKDYPNLKWTELSSYYKLKNGRVDVEPFRARHIRITFTNLRPLLLKEFYSEN